MSYFISYNNLLKNPPLGKKDELAKTKNKNDFPTLNVYYSFAPTILFVDITILENLKNNFQYIIKTILETKTVLVSVIFVLKILQHKLFKV